jgi:hypothetical protein
MNINIKSSNNDGYDVNDNLSPKSKIEGWHDIKIPLRCFRQNGRKRTVE